MEELKYRLIVDIDVVNENYEKELQDSKNNFVINSPSKIVSKKILEVALNYDEFLAVKKAVIEKIK